jgi:hypothetical protein
VSQKRNYTDKLMHIFRTCDVEITLTPNLRECYPETISTCQLIMGRAANSYTESAWRLCEEYPYLSPFTVAHDSSSVTYRNYFCAACSEWVRQWIITDADGQCKRPHAPQAPQAPSMSLQHMSGLLDIRIQSTQLSSVDVSCGGGGGGGGGGGV